MDPTQSGNAERLEHPRRGRQQARLDHLQEDRADRALTALRVLAPEVHQMPGRDAQKVIHSTLGK
jgi:hypothetical protein